MIQLNGPTLSRWRMRSIFRGDASSLIPSLTGLVLIAIWVATFNWTARERASAERKAQIAAQNLSGVYRVQMLRALREIDLTINVVRYVSEQKGLTRALANLESELLIPTALLFVIDVADHHGDIVATNNDNRGEVSRAVDQPHFRFFSEHTRLGDTLYVGPAVRDPRTGKSRMTFARRLTDANNAFAGVVSVSINPEYFTSDYEPSRMGLKGTLGVLGARGDLIVARSGDKIIEGNGTGPLKHLIPATPEDEGAAKLLLSPWDGIKRYTVSESLSMFGITTVVGLSEEEQLASFLPREQAYRWQATLVSALVIALGMLLRQLARSRSRVLKAQETYLAASEASRDATFVLHSLCDSEGAISDFALTDTNSRGVALLNLNKSAMLGKPIGALLPDIRDTSAFKVLCQVVNTGIAHDQEWENHEPSIRAQWLHAQVVRAGSGVVAIVRDISERKRIEAELVRRNNELTALNHKLTETHQQLVQSEKLASIGLLAAGVAHEINNPIGFVLSNIGALDGYFNSLLQMLDTYQETESQLADLALRTRILDLKDQLEFDYIKDDIPLLMRETKDGIERVRKIVQDLKDFSHVDNSQEWQMANLHDGINSTLNMVNSEVKYKAEIIKEYGDIPLVECLPSEINQVVMNLVVNAAHAIGETRGKITVRTSSGDDSVSIEVEDTGCGISPDNLVKIFDPFFTTKPVGKGTGLGLSLSYGIVQKHAGQMSVHSVEGEGTTFRVTLPLKQSTQKMEVIPSPQPS
ncbi:ATP-binding protein [Aquabacterium sp.]|uniref:ATP-binding protein n=1 Tax=Aquabacterium sp. TaxID=1872578 RepID=UPI002486DBC3|nr:ATP-binding protein [Aquabacterium sp.]MDI1258839.1 ATP-binding protein [Aquabacterium sp.]